jgi:hypothetical protein
MSSDAYTPAPTDGAILSLRHQRESQEHARIVDLITHIANELGIDRGKIHIDLKPTKSKGRVQVELSIPPEIQDQVIKRYGIKAFNPEKGTITIAGIEGQLEVGEEPSEPSRPWASAERKRQSKPNSNTPERPGQ